jgi:hypothetical protein
MNSDYNRIELENLGSILSYQNYSKIEDLDLKKHKKIVFERRFSENHEYCFVSRDIKEGQLCFIGHKDDENIYFYHLIFDSIMGRLELDYSAFSNDMRGQVTLKQLKKFLIVEVPEDIMKAGALLDIVIMYVLQIMRHDDDKQFLESVRNVMQELRDYFVLELYSKQVFERHNIEIVNTVVNLFKENNFTKINDAVILIIKAVTDSSSPLLSNMRRYRVLISGYNVSQNPKK